MKRRDFIKILSVSVPVLYCGCSGLFHRHGAKVASKTEIDPASPKNSGPAEPSLAPPSRSELEDIADNRPNHFAHGKQNSQASTLDAKRNFFDQDYADDIFVESRRRGTLDQCLLKFRAVQRRVGSGHFNLLGMDELFYQASLTGSGAFSSEEKQFLESLFFFDASKYGFLGEKNFQRFTETVNKSEMEKVAGTGHYLRRGRSLETYLKIRRDIGDTLTLTSGMRALAKQFHLFLEKAVLSGGNLSRASRSLAPPGYSFHGSGDFDIGRVGFGLRNFTDDFASTSEYKRLSELGYVDIRYDEVNQLGVRFEPWHVKV